MNEHEQEYGMLMEMDRYELHSYLIQQDLTYWRWQLDHVRHLLNKAHGEEQWFIRMAKKSLTFYNEEDGMEEDWVAFEQYSELAKNMKPYQQQLREQLPDITNNIRRYKKEWEQAQKMLELQQKLTQRQQKN